MADDKGKLKVDKKTQQLIDLAMETGNDRIVLELQQRVSSHPNKNRSFHYLPYRTDSGFEQTFLKEVLNKNGSDIPVIRNPSVIASSFRRFSFTRFRMVKK